MNKSIIRFVLFLGVASGTVAILLLLRDEPTVPERIGVAFLVLAEVLVTLVPAAAGRHDFPLRTPLFLFAFPGYLVLTLALAVFAGLFAWRMLLVLELAAALPIFVAVCVVALAGRSREDMK